MKKYAPKDAPWIESEDTLILRVESARSGWILVTRSGQVNSDHGEAWSWRICSPSMRSWSESIPVGLTADGSQRVDTRIWTGAGQAGGPPAPVMEALLDYLLAFAESGEGSFTRRDLGWVRHNEDILSMARYDLEKYNNKS